MALVPWLAARVVVVGTLALARVVASRAHVDAAAAVRVHEGLLGWDAGWYESIAAHGYHASGYQSLRFWPLLPLLGRALTILPGVAAGTGILVVANAGSLIGIALVARLAFLETEDQGLARRAAWLMAIAPPAFVYVMGYAEGLLLVATAGAFLALRRQAWWWAALCGVVGALTRPLGMALVVPALVETSRSWWEPWWIARRRRHATRPKLDPDPPSLEAEAEGPRSAGGGARDERADEGGVGAVGSADASGPGDACAGAAAREVVRAVDAMDGTDAVRGVGTRRASPRRHSCVLGRVAAVVAPIAGTLLYLGWVQWRFHHFLAPIDIQEQSDRHGHLADPLVTMAHDLVTLAHGHHLDQGMHVPWVVLVVILVVVALRTLPLSYGLFAAAIVAVAVSGTNLDSFQRYALSAFPVVIAGAVLTGSPRVERVIMIGCVAGLVAYGLMAFLNILVP